MAATTYNKIGIAHRWGEEWTYQEGIAESSSTIVPGDLIEHESGGEFQEHSTADGFAAGLVADINLYDDDTATAAIDKVYAAGDTVRAIRTTPGDTLYMRLTTSQTAVIGSPLGSTGDGTLKVITPGAGTIDHSTLFEAQEAVTTTAAIARIIVKRV
jgi:hypothetical protein